MSFSHRPSSFRWSVSAAATVFIVLFKTVAVADAPSGHELIAKFLELSGGQKAYAKIQNRVIEAKLDLPDHGMEGELTEILAPPNYRRVIVIDVYDANVTCVTDGVPWILDAQEGPIPLKGARAADVKRHAQLNPLLDWTPASGRAEVVGEAKVGEEECYRVELSPIEGSPLWAFFSKKTGLLRRMDNRTVNMYRYFDDYRKQDGVLVPYALRFEAGMMMADLEIVSIKQNVDLDDTTFDQPPQTEATKE